MTDLAAMYLDTHARLSELVAGLDRAAVATAVPACPGWSVADVVAHVTAVADDALAGRLTGPPSDEQTAEQVARYKDVPVDDVLSAWSELAPKFAEVVGAFEVWPAALDVAAHEQDVRGALGLPGYRDTDIVRSGAARLVRLLNPPRSLVVEVEDAMFPVEGADGAADELRLRTTRWEVFRFRLGRRSRAQLAAMAWSGDPAPILDHLAIFGPARADVVE
jgi:uncharacterized protein (TIGR03083 family)